MTLLDGVLVAFWLGVTLGGLWKGAIRIVAGIGGAAVGVWLAVVAHTEVTAVLAGWTSVAWLAAALGWLAPPVLCLALAVAAGWGMERTLEALHLGWLNRLAGAALAGVVGAGLLGLLLATATAASPTVDRLWEQSMLARSLDRVSSLVGVGQASADDSTPSTDEGSSSGR